MSSGTSRNGAVVLLSGGLDSATVLALALQQERDVTAVSFDYGQRHSTELLLASARARSAGLEHVVIDVGLDVFGGSALTDERLKVPSGDLDGKEIPVTYVPARNLVFLSIAVGVAEAVDASEIWIGANAIDYSGYPDCRPEFFAAFQKAIEAGTKSGVERREPRIITPLIDLTKAEIIQTGLDLGVDYGATWSCYEGGEISCGRCDSCLLRRRGFEQLGMTDPLPYAS